MYFIYLSGKLSGSGFLARNILYLSSNACPMVVMTSWANPPPHSSTWQARPLASLATYATKSMVSASPPDAKDTEGMAWLPIIYTKDVTSLNEDVMGYIIVKEYNEEKLIQ